MQKALIRASYFKTLIGDAKRLPEPDRGAILGAVGEPLRAEIRQAPLVGWFPAEEFARLTDIIGERLGPRGAIAFWRRSMLASLGRSFLMPLKVGALGIYGKSPGSLIKMTPRAWSLLAKDCGDCKVEDASATSVIVRFTDLHAAIRARGMTYVWAGGCDACVEEVGFQGSSSIHDERLGLGRVEIVTSWQEARA